MNTFITKFFNRESTAAWIFILPALLGTLIFIVIPVFCSFGLSFFRWDLLNRPEFAGFSNYIDLFRDSLFYKIFINTIAFALATTVFGVVIPLILASVLNTKIRGSEFYKTAYFLPFITPMIVIGIIWSWIFDRNIGVVNQILRLNIAWLYDSNFAMPALIIVSVWKLVGYNMLIFLSSFSAMPVDLYEAAKIDGASCVQIFKNITVPLLSPAIFFVVIITTISSFQVFDLVYLMTQGGPLDSTNVLVYAIYKNAFEYFNAGSASAIAYVLFLVVLILTLIQWKLRKKLVYIED